jgi:Spy/CpxP family protein refolding chaperone
MKNILKIAVAMSVFAALTVSSYAQGAGPSGGAPAAGGKQGKGGKQGGPGGRKGGMMNMDAELLAKLNLTEDQKKKVKALKEKTQADMKKIFEGAKGDREGMREKFKPVMENYQKEMAKILTPTQMETLKKEMKEMRKKAGNKNGGKIKP